jgi:hypothetical protein
MFSLTGFPRLDPEVDDAAASFQLKLATLPLFLVLLYFLLAAAIRPSKAIYHIPSNINDDAYIKMIMQETGHLIALYDMLLVFLFLTAFWCSLALYILVFVPKRRDLLLLYQVEGETVIGDVYYEENKHWFSRFRDFGYAIYPHPTRKGFVVRKRVRVFQHYTRERVAILCLPNRALSGQPKTDLEIDVAVSAENTERVHSWGKFFITWATFTYLSCFFLLIQMGRIHDSYDNETKGWITFVVASLIGIPGFAVGGNYFRWWLHYQWVTRRGAVVDAQSLTKEGLREVLTTIRSEDDYSHHHSQAAYVEDRGDVASSFSNTAPSDIPDTYTMSDYRSVDPSAVSSL